MEKGEREGRCQAGEKAQEKWVEEMLG